MDRNIQVSLRLLKKGNNSPLNENGVHVKLFDKDPVSDDFLGQATPEEDGTVHITFNEKDLRSLDTPLEEYADLFFIVYINDTSVYQSPVAVDREPTEHGNFSMENGYHIDLGTFLI